MKGLTIPIRLIDESRSHVSKRNLVTSQNNVKRIDYGEYPMHRTLQRILLDEMDQNVDTSQIVLDVKNEQCKKRIWVSCSRVYKPKDVVVDGK